MRTTPPRCSPTPGPRYRFLAPAKALWVSGVGAGYLLNFYRAPSSPPKRMSSPPATRAIQQLRRRCAVAMVWAAKTWFTQMCHVTDISVMSAMAAAPREIGGCGGSATANMLAMEWADRGLAQLVTRPILKAVSGEREELREVCAAVAPLLTSFAASAPIGLLRVGSILTCNLQRATGRRRRPVTFADPPQRLDEVPRRHW